MLAENFGSLQVYCASRACCRSEFERRRESLLCPMRAYRARTPELLRVDVDEDILVPRVRLKTQRKINERANESTRSTCTPT